jgi:SGNH domain (fused to AT3 domains)
VAAAPSITTLPSNVTPTLATAGNDDAVTEFPSLTPCVEDGVHEPSCVFGDTSGSKTMVLFGDSHALMWFPALDAVAKAAKWRLVALMNYGCPVADVTVWDVLTNKPTYGCPGWRNAMIKRIDKLHAALVVVSEAFYTLNASDKTITDQQWTSAVEKSLHSLRGAHTKEVLIGQSYLVTDPIDCLASNPDDVQKCSWPEHTASFTAELAADSAAAKGAKATYVNEVPWTCSATCTAVIGNMIVYNSTGHLSATYDTYLTDVLRLALKTPMR